VLSSPTTFGSGNGRVLIGVPCDPTLLGLSLEVQRPIVTGAGAPCPITNKIALSNTLRLVLGNYGSRPGAAEAAGQHHPGQRPERNVRYASRRCTLFRRVSCQNP
jgi:hypothetical protein